MMPVWRTARAGCSVLQPDSVSPRLRRIGDLCGLPRRYLQGVREKPAPSGRYDAQAGWKGHGLEGRACESCHGPAQKHTESADAQRHPQSGKACRRRRRQNLSHLPPESADARRALAEQPRERSGLLHVLPQSSRQRAGRIGGRASRPRSTSSARAATSTSGRSFRGPIITSCPKAR